MPLDLFISTSYFAFEHKEILGGVGHRYVGLYASLVKTLLNKSPKSKVFWYSHDGKWLRVISREGVRKYRTTMLGAIFNVISVHLKTGSHLAVIAEAAPTAAHSAALRFGRAVDYVSCLWILRIFNTGRLRVIVDDFEPQVESTCGFSETELSKLAVFGMRVLEMLTLKAASSITVVSESYKRHLARLYRIKKEKLFVVSNGSLVRYVPYSPTKSEDPFSVLYAGVAMKVKDVDKLVSTIAKIREKGHIVDLHIAGAKMLDLPRWVHVASYDWPDFVNRLLSEADVGVIPYPPDRFHFCYSLPAKLFDYMAAGKPVISTSLRETGDIIRMFDCGLVARDWEEFELHLERLYHDRELARKLGENGRMAAEKQFDYELIAEALLGKLVRMFNDDQ